MKSSCLILVSSLLVQAMQTTAFVPSSATPTSPRTRVVVFDKKTAGKKGGGFGRSSNSRGAGFGVLQQDSFPYAGSIRPGQQSPPKSVPSHIGKPDYAVTGRPSGQRPRLPWIIETKTPDEILKMKAAGALARQVLDAAGRAALPGVTTDEIDALVHEMIVQSNAYPSPLNYHGYPKSCCTSVNEVICHGIPDNRKLESGDVINIDITVYLNGFHGDCSEMFAVGGREALDESAQKLLQTTYDCWLAACQYVQPGRDYKDLGAIMEDIIVPAGYTTVKAFCGHGIGQMFHTTPNILHYRNHEPNGQMAAGHTFTIEPMICEGSAQHLSWPDQWTATTVDGKRSAQFEHTLLVTEDGVEALTGKTEDSLLQFWEQESSIHQGIWLGTSAAAKQKQDSINAALLA